MLLRLCRGPRGGVLVGMGRREKPSVMRRGGRSHAQRGGAQGGRGSRARCAEKALADALVARAAAARHTLIIRIRGQRMSVLNMSVGGVSFGHGAEGSEDSSDENLSVEKKTKKSRERNRGEGGEGSVGFWHQCDTPNSSSSSSRETASR